MKDIGDYLEVPEDQRAAVDDHPVEEVNLDEFTDLSGVPEGEYVELSTAGDDEPLEDEPSEDEEA